MTSTTTPRRFSIRPFLIAIALMLASIFATGSASASVQNSGVDIGSPGGMSASTAAHSVDLADSVIPGIRVL